MPTPTVSRVAKNFTFVVCCTAGFGKLVTFDYSPAPHGQGHTTCVQKIVTDMGAVFTIGALSFNAAISRFSQPHVMKALEEVVRGEVGVNHGGRWVLSAMKSAGGQTGCLTLVSLGILKASLTFADMPMATEMLLSLPFTIWPILLGLPFFFPVALPILLPGFAVAYVGGAVTGQIAGRLMLLSANVVRPLHSTQAASSGFGRLSRLYSTHPWLARVSIFGAAAIAYLPTHQLDSDWQQFSSFPEDGSWSYRKSFFFNNGNDGGNNDKDAKGDFKPYGSDGGDEYDNTVRDNTSEAEVHHDGNFGDNLNSRSSSRRRGIYGSPSPSPDEDEDDDGGVEI